jgi:molecular chaperone HscB
MKKVVVAAANRSMSNNGFELFGLPQAFDIDESALHRAYIQLQQRSHPDRLARAQETEKLAAMQLSADANHAYTTLKDPLLRAEYLLGLKGYVLGDKPEAVKASQSLLIDSMEMREALFEAENFETVSALKAKAEAGQLESISRISTTYAAGEYDACAQAAIRLRFLRKFLDEVKKRTLMLG